MAVVFEDHFTRTADITLASHVPDTVGTGWAVLRTEGSNNPSLTVFQSTDTIGGAAATTSGVVYNVVPDVTASEFDLSFKWTTLDTTTSTGPIGVVFRWIDENNYYGFRTLPNGNTTTTKRRLYKVTNGTVSVLASDGVNLTAGQIYTIKVRNNGITLAVNGVDALTTADAAWTTPGKVGFRSGILAVEGTGNLRAAWRNDDFIIDALSSGPAPTEYTSTLLGSVAFAGLVSENTNKRNLGTLTSAGLLRKDVDDNQRGTVTPTGLLSKSTMSVVGAILAVAGALSSVKGRAALVIERTLTAALALSGTVSRSSTKRTPGTLTPTGRLSRSTADRLTGATTPTGRAVKDVGNRLIGTLTPSGRIQRAVAATRAGATALAGALNSFKVGGAQTFNKLLEGTVALSGSMSRASTRTVRGTLASTGALTKATARRLSSGVAASGSLVRSVTRQVRLAGTLVTTGAVRRAVSTGLRAMVGLSGALNSALQGGAQTFNLLLQGSIALSGRVGRAVGKETRGLLTPTGQNRKNAQIGLIGAILSAGNLSRRVGILVRGVSSILGHLSRLSGRNLGGTVTPVSRVSRNAGKRATGTVAPTGRIGRGIDKVLVAVLGLSGYLRHQIAAVRIFMSKNRWVRMARPVRYDVVPEPERYERVRKPNRYEVDDG